MPRILTSDERITLYAKRVRVRTLVTFYMDDGIYRYTDDVNDVTHQGKTWIAASAIAACSDVKSGQSLSAEQVTLTIDGTRVRQVAGVDPNELFRYILDLNIHNRRVEVEYGLSRFNLYDESEVHLVLPAFTALMNHIKVVAPSVDYDSISDPEFEQPEQILEIVLDSISVRYGWATGRTRSDADQRELFPGDRFFRFVNDAAQNESRLYWGKPAAGNLNK